MVCGGAHVVSGARSFIETAGVAARCRIEGGSFFERIPEGADAIILKSIIHDWDDEKGLAILRNCHRALKRQGRLLLIERVMPARTDEAPEVIMRDVHMMAVTGGRERNEDEFRALLTGAGFRLMRIIPTPSGFSIIEGLHP